MLKVNLSFLILISFLSVQVVRTQTCRSTIQYEENPDEKIGRFQFIPDSSTKSSYLQVKVFVTDDCQKGACILSSETNIKNTGKLYKEGRPINYKVVFRDQSKNATITHIGVRTSQNCTAICTGPELKSTAKSIQYAFYPSGRESALSADCDTRELFSKSNASSLTLINTPENIDDLPLEEFCGIVPGGLTNLAIGGTEIRRGSWPWLVGLYTQPDYGIKFLCGATLISERVVLTAAHCLKDVKEDDLVLLMGRHNRVDFNERGPQYRVHHLVKNEEYREGTSSFDADIAILITDRDVRFTDLIRPACLWQGEETINELAGKIGHIVGWGLDETKSLSKVPKEVHGKIVNDTECIVSNDLFPDVTTRRNFCAGNRDGTGPCNGDSGGAFMLLENNRWTIRGIVSGILDTEHDICDLSNFVVYTDITKFKSWIHKKMELLLN